MTFQSTIHEIATQSVFDFSTASPADEGHAAAALRQNLRLPATTFLKFFTFFT